MASPEEHKLLKKNRSVVEKMIMSDMDWFADELNAEDVAVLTDSLCNEVKNPVSMKTPEQKAAMVVKYLLNRVDVYPQALGEFVVILKKKPKKFKVLIDKLDLTSGKHNIKHRMPIMYKSQEKCSHQLKSSLIQKQGTPLAI